MLGFFLFAVVSLLVYEAWLLRHRVMPFLATTPLLEQAGPAQGFWSPPSTASWRLTWSSAFSYAAVAGVLVAIGFVILGKIVPAIVVLLLLLVVGLVPWHRQRPDRLLLLGMIATALALTAAVELIVLKGDVGRMNTVFKFYLQVWVLLGLAAAIAAVRLLQRWRPGRASWQWWSVGAAVLLAACLIYPVQATPVKLALRFDPVLPPTDDGMAYMNTAVYGDKGQNIPLDVDYRAITWMQDNVPGSPVVLEANTGLYKWGSRVSVLTGLPTVVGWDWHQRQQRGDFSPMVEERVRDVQTMYETPDWSQRHYASAEVPRPIHLRRAARARLLLAGGAAEVPRPRRQRARPRVRRPGAGGRRGGLHQGRADLPGQGLCPERPTDRAHLRASRCGVPAGPRPARPRRTVVPRQSPRTRAWPNAL